MVGRSDELLQAKRLLAGQEADVGHANHRKTVPTFGTQCSSGASLAYGVRRLARTEISSEQSIANDRRSLRRNALVIEAECSEARSVLLAGVGDNVYHLAAVA